MVVPPAGCDAEQERIFGVDPTMPRTDLECKARGLGTDVPCPFVGCRHHLALDINGYGKIRKSRQRDKTCSLAEARKGDHSISEVAELLGVIDNRVWQIEARALAKVARALGMEGLTGLREIVRKLLGARALTSKP